MVASTCSWRDAAMEPRVRIHVLLKQDYKSQLAITESGMLASTLLEYVPSLWLYRFSLSGT